MDHSFPPYSRAWSGYAIIKYERRELGVAVILGNAVQVFVDVTIESNPDLNRGYVCVHPDRALPAKPIFTQAVLAGYRERLIEEDKRICAFLASQPKPWTWQPSGALQSERCYPCLNLKSEDSVTPISIDAAGKDQLVAAAEPIIQGKIAEIITLDSIESEVTV
jgi:hypothetical protein